MTFRDDREASRARIEALEEDLAAAKAEAEAAKREVSAAKQATEEARRRSAPGRAKRSNRAALRVLAALLGLGAISMGIGYWAEHRSHGWTIPMTPGMEERPVGCSCMLADGRMVQLGVRVNGAEVLPSPGRPWRMSLAWQAYGVGEPLRLSDPLGNADLAPPSAVQEALTSGYVVDLGLACVGSDLLVMASGAHVTTWSLSARDIAYKNHVEPSKQTALSGRRMELRCSALEKSGDTVKVPSKKGDIALQIRPR